MSYADTVAQTILYKLTPIICVVIIIRMCRGHLKNLHRRIFAAVFAKMMEKLGKKLEKRKKRLFAGLHDTSQALERPMRILEIGAGSGSNFKFFPDGSEIICVDPNPYFSKYLEARKTEFPNVNLREVVVGQAEDMSEVLTGSVDAVICTLVLCSVTDMEKSLEEIHRVLRQDGRFYYYEHVCANKSTWLYWCQCLLRPVFRVIGDGCNLTRETWLDLEKSKFSKTDHERFIEKGSAFFMAVVKPTLAGYATK